MNNWRKQLTDRERRLVANCEVYASGDAAGLPGHNLAVIIAKMAALLDGFTGGSMPDWHDPAEWHAPDMPVDGADSG